MATRLTVQWAVRTPEVEAWTSAELTQLSAALGSPTAWTFFLHQSFRRSRHDGQALPALRRSLRVWMLCCDAALLSWRAGATRRWPPPGAFGWAIGALLLAEWHLGMIPTRDDPNPTGLALPNGLTLLRMLLPAGIVGASGRGTSGIRACIALGALVTDVLDGYLARRAGAQTHFGAIADPLADAAIWTTLATTARSGRYSRILGWLVVLRYGTPMVLALAVTFRRGRTYDWYPSAIGRWSSAALASLLTLREIHGVATSRIK